jgi:Uma2 family endonuclease
MATALPPSSPPQPPLPGVWSMADLQEHLGGIPAERIRVFPSPGFATEEDLIGIADREDRFCELEDGVLVEKPMGWYESLLASLIIIEIGLYLRENDLGQVLGADGAMRILPRTIKIPDVSFVGWDRWPKERLPRRPIPALVPHLVVEVLSETNTEREMERKLRQYFEAGVQLVWYIDPATRSARAFTSPTDVTAIDESGVLDGGTVLPGFKLSLSRVFAKADRPRPGGAGN